MLAELARRAGGGRALYYGWHAPRAALTRLRREGMANLALARLGRLEMERAATSLPPMPYPMEGAPEIYYLSGRRFAYQTVFCAVSLGYQARQSFRVVVVDDGTLSLTDVALLRRVLPGVRLVGSAETAHDLEVRLPASRYPVLRRIRLAYPHLRKLTDVHAAGGGWKLVLDSDMLFHGKPGFLLDWLASPARPCHMVDVADAYGYPSDLLEELSGGPLPTRLNVGMCGLHSEGIDWDRIEGWCKELIGRKGVHYLLEQALVAMLTAGQGCAIAPSDTYIVAPSRSETERPLGILHHYTAQSKAWYFRFGWRQIMGCQARGAVERINP